MTQPPMVHRATTAPSVESGTVVLDVTMSDCDGVEHVLRLPPLVALRLANQLMAFVLDAVEAQP